jgi:hypothetical protein
MLQGGVTPFRCRHVWRKVASQTGREWVGTVFRQLAPSPVVSALDSLSTLKRCLCAAKLPIKRFPPFGTNASVGTYWPSRSFDPLIR